MWTEADVGDLRGRTALITGANDYARSKLANLLFAQELQHRFTAPGADTLAVAAHPGGARTNIVRHSARMSRRLDRPEPGWRRHFFQEPEVAALSVVRAATDPSARGGEFYGPDGRFGLTGMPAVTRPALLVHARSAAPALGGVGAADRYSLRPPSGGLKEVAAREEPGGQARCPSR